MGKIAVDPRKVVECSEKVVGNSEKGALWTSKKAAAVDPEKSLGYTESRGIGKIHQVFGKTGGAYSGKFLGTRERCRCSGKVAVYPRKVAGF